MWLYFKVTGEYFTVENQNGRRPFKAVLDVGLSRTTTGCKIFGVMKGVVDGGIDVPHRFVAFVDMHKRHMSSVCPAWWMGIR